MLPNYGLRESAVESCKGRKVVAAKESAKAFSFDTWQTSQPRIDATSSAESRPHYTCASCWHAFKAYSDGMSNQPSKSGDNQKKLSNDSGSSA